MESSKEDTFRRMGFINRLGCIAIASAVLLILLFGILLTHSSLKTKQGKALSEMDNLRDVLLAGLEKPRSLGRYMRDKPGFEALIVGIGVLKNDIEMASSLEELDAQFDIYQHKSSLIMEMIPADKAEEQAVRNTEAEINGVYNHYHWIRKDVVEAVTSYENALNSFPESLVARWFGLKPISSGEEDVQ